MTRRSPGEGSIKQRSDGRWEGRIDLGYDERGERKRKYLYGRSKAEVRRKLQQALRDKEQGRLVASGNEAPKTVAAWFARWLETVKTVREPKTYRQYEQLSRVHIVPALGRLRLDRLTSAQVERFLLGKYDDGKGLSPQSVHHLQAVLSAALSKAARQGLIGRNVASSELLDLPPIPERTYTILSGEQAIQFIRGTQTDRLHAAYLTSLVLGLRQEHVLGLVWDDVDIEGRTLRISRKLLYVNGEWHLAPVSRTKCAPRTLPLPAPVAAALREHRIRQNWEREIAADGWLTFEHEGEPINLVFTNTRGGPLAGTEVTKRFQRRLAALGLPRMHFHELRHSAATAMLALKVPETTIAKVLGHSTLKLLHDTYGHLFEDVEMVREHLEGLDKLWSPDTHASGGA